MDKVHFDEMEEARNEIAKMRATMEEMKNLGENSIEGSEETNTIQFFKFDQCGKEFDNSNSLKYHINKKHGGNKHRFET